MGAGHSRSLLGLDFHVAFVGAIDVAKRINDNRIGDVIAKVGRQLGRAIPTGRIYDRYAEATQKLAAVLSSFDRAELNLLKDCVRVISTWWRLDSPRSSVSVLDMKRIINRLIRKGICTCFVDADSKWRRKIFDPINDMYCAVGGDSLPLNGEKYGMFIYPLYWAQVIWHITSDYDLMGVD